MTLKAIKTKAIPIFKRQGITKVAIFGSYAHGTNTKSSDVDFLVKVPKGMTLFGLGGLKVDLEEALKKQVDIVTYGGINHRLKDIILNSQKIIYEQKPKKDDKVFLGHILDSIEYPENHIREMSSQDFHHDVKTQDVVVRRFQIIGEAVKNLSDELKYMHAYIDWKDITGMRDMVVHEYFGVKLDVVWDTVTKDIPVFKKLIQEILQELEN